MFMHDVAHLLMPSRRSVAAITSVITGTNFLTHLDHRLAHTFVSLRYTLPEIEEKSDEPRLTSRWQGGGAGSDGMRGCNVSAIAALPGGRVATGDVFGLLSLWE